MPTSLTRPQRARQPEEKRLRRDEILKAAERLWLTKSYSTLSMNEIAREAKLAKGTLYLYFSNKEELFLELLVQHLEIWLEQKKTSLQTEKPTTANACAEILLDNLQEFHSLRRLLVLYGTVLDENILPEQAQNFRRNILRHVNPLLEVMPFHKETNLRLLMHLYSLSAGWHLSVERCLAIPKNDLGHLPAELQRPSFTNELRLSYLATVQAITHSKP